jgi:hypothetical protein
MINEIIINIINNAISSFDIPFCIIINIATYLIVSVTNGIKQTTKLTTWNKRVIFLFVSIIIGIIYCLLGSDYRIILNSIILAPVSWSWIFKPICAKLKIDYNSKEVTE